MSVSLILLLICYPHKQMDNTTTKVNANPMPESGDSFGDGGEVTVLEKSRTVKHRKLIAGHQGNFNNRGGPGPGGECGIMGCVGSDCEDELRLCPSSTISRYKLPKKCLDECSTVCHVSVPRKLRSSAMKKRRSESISPALQVSNKLNRIADGDQLQGNDGLMKSKLKMKQVEPEGCVTNYIQEAVTKDEEEVAEALYALSGVFPNYATTDKTNLAGGGLGAKSLTSTKAEIFVPSVDGSGKDELETANHRDGKTPNLSSNATASAGETATLQSLKDTTKSDCSTVKQSPVKFDSDIPKVNLHLTAFITENQRAICDSVSGAWTQLRKTRSKLATHEKSQTHYQYQEIVLPPIADACDKTQAQHANNKTENNGSPSRTDLSSAISCNNQKLGIPFQSHIAKLPSRIESSSGSAKFPTLESNVIDEKVAPFSTQSKNSWKRCSTHLYISRFTKAFQDKDLNNRMMMQSSMRNEVPNQRAHRTNIDQSGGRNCLIGVSSDTSGVSSLAKNATEVKNAILLYKRLVKDQQQASKSYDVFTAQKQSLGFLSMHAGGGRVENSTDINRAGNALEASASVRVPFLQSQNQVYIPFPGPQNLYSSTSSSGHCPVAAGLQVQLPPYFDSRLYAPPFTDANALSVQPIEQQNCNRPLLLIANFESGVVPPNIPNKQTGGTEIPPFLHPAQSSFPHFLSSLEAPGYRYPPILQQQQQQLVSASSLLHSSRTKGPYHLLPTVYEANVGRVRSDNASLQIICHQYI